MDFLINKLYGKWSDHLHVETDPITGEQYLRISDLATMPANVLYNFCISSRLPMEFPNTVQHWAEMVDRGINPGVALGVCRIGVMKDRYGGMETNTNHWPVDNTSDLKLLATYTPKDVSLNFKNCPGAVTPCNVLWGTATDLAPLTTVDDEAIDSFWSQWKEQNDKILLAS